MTISEQLEAARAEIKAMEARLERLERMEKAALAVDQKAFSADGHFTDAGAALLQAAYDFAALAGQPPEGETDA